MKKHLPNYTHSLAALTGLIQFDETHNKQAVNICDPIWQSEAFVADLKIDGF